MTSSVRVNPRVAAEDNSGSNILESLRQSAPGGGTTGGTQETGRSIPAWAERHWIGRPTPGRTWFYPEGPESCPPVQHQTPGTPCYCAAARSKLSVSNRPRMSWPSKSTGQP